MYSVFTIIVTYNGMRNDWIDKCLRSLKKSSYPTNIIVVDNNSSDDTCEFILSNYQHITLIQNKVNKGFGGANNQGIELALNREADYVFLLNQDAYIEEDTIEELVDKASRFTDYGVISPIHLNGNATALDYNFSNYITPNRCAKLYSDFLLNRVEDKIYSSDFICAAAWFIPKKTFEIVGGFSPTFFHYGEDNNYVHRLQFKGLKIGVVPSSRILHDRENRTKSSYDKKQFKERKDLLIRISNPNNTFNINVFKKQVRINYLKNLILLNFKNIKEINEKSHFIKKLESTILINYSLSKSNQKYIFLNITNDSPNC